MSERIQIELFKSLETIDAGVRVSVIDATAKLIKQYKSERSKFDEATLKQYPLHQMVSSTLGDLWNPVRQIRLNRPNDVPLSLVTPGLSVLCGLEIGGEEYRWVEDEEALGKREQVILTEEDLQQIYVLSGGSPKEAEQLFQ